VVNLMKKSYIQRVRDRKNFSLGMRGLMVVGRGYHRTETRVNRMFINYKDSKSYIKDISNEVAVERGVEFLAEFFVYSFLIGLSFYEIAKSIESAHKKEKASKDAMKNLVTKVSVLEETQSKLDVDSLNTLEKRMGGIEQITKESQKSITNATNDLSTELNKKVEEELKRSQSEVLQLLSDIKTKCTTLEEETKMFKDSISSLQSENRALNQEIDNLRLRFDIEPVP